MKNWKAIELESGRQNLKQTNKTNKFTVSSQYTISVLNSTSEYNGALLNASSTLMQNKNFTLLVTWETTKETTSTLVVTHR